MNLITRPVGRSKADNTAPVWILRHHAPSPIHALRLVRLASNENDDVGSNRQHGDIYILAGDAQGRVSLTALSDVRPRLFWKAHASSVLGVDIVAHDGSTLAILTSGRDNELIAWRLSFYEASLLTLPSRIQDDLPVPEKLASIGINALNYCSFSANVTRDGTLVATPHAMDSGYMDVLRLPAGKRTLRAIGKPDIQSKGQRAPMIMSMHLFGSLIYAGYEDGYVRLWKIVGETAELVWAQRKHSESIMAAAVSHDGKFAVSVAADDVIARYDAGDTASTITGTCKSMGHASVAISTNGRRISVGGWDGSVRVFDANLQRVARLQYHKDTVQAVATLEVRTFATEYFGDDARHIASDSDQSLSDDGERTQAQDRLSDEAESLLISGGKEGRICLWRIS